MNQTNIADFWTLEGGGATMTAAAAGVTEIVRRRASARTETCTLYRQGQPFDAAPLFPPGSRVVVRRDGTPWFVGRVTGATGSGDGRAEESALVLAGPWWFLENLVYRQTRTRTDGTADGPSGRVVLGRAEDGTRLTVGQTIAAVAQYAVDAGAPWRVGTVEGDVTLPLDALRNVTCAQAIRRVLRWLPESVAWFDHGDPAGPTFHCRARLDLPAVTLTVGEPPLTAVRGLAVQPGPSMPAVVLHYETERGDSAELLTDAAPPGATGTEFGAFVATIPVREEAAGDGDGTAGSFACAADLPDGRGGTGLAAALLAARAAATYRGRVELTEAEAGGTALGPGTTLNLDGSARAEWATMRALILEDEVAVIAGRSVVWCGTTAAEDGTAATAGVGEGRELAEALRAVR